MANASKKQVPLTCVNESIFWHPRTSISWSSVTMANNWRNGWNNFTITYHHQTMDSKWKNKKKNGKGLNWQKKNMTKEKKGGRIISWMSHRVDYHILFKTNSLSLNNCIELYGADDDMNPRIDKKKTYHGQHNHRKQLERRLHMVWLLWKRHNRHIRIHHIHQWLELLLLLVQQQRNHDDIRLKRK